MRRQSVQANVSFEVELTFTAEYHPAIPERGPTYDCGGEPGEPAGVEDVTLVNFGAVKYVPFAAKNNLPRFEIIDLLDGVDTKNPEVLKLLQNLCDFCAEDAEHILISEAQS